MTTARPAPAREAARTDPDVGVVLRAAQWDGLPPVTEAVSPDGRRVLTEIGPNLGWRHVGDLESTPLTRCGTGDQPWRVNAQVYSVLPAGPVWSPDGRVVVSIRADLSDVPLHSFVDGRGGAETSQAVRLPREGSPHRGLGRLALVAVPNGDITWVDLPAYVHWTPVRWLSGGRQLLALGTDLAGELWLSRIDRENGTAATLVRERVPSVFPYLAALFSAVSTPLPGSDDVLWTSDRDGDLRLYLVNGVQATPVSPPGTQVEGVLAADDDVMIVARSNGDDPYGVQVGRLAGGSFQAVHEQPAPRDGGQPFVVKAADGLTDLHGLLFTPPGFVPQGHYPVVDCLYGGPQAIAHRCDHSGAGHHLWGCCPSVAASLAGLGFVTVVLDSRGTPGRGRDFLWPDRDEHGDVVIADHREALRNLAADRPWMDLGRVGVIGTSFGGYYAVLAGLVAPDLFRAVVAHAGPYQPANALPGWFPGVLGTSYRDDPEVFRDADLVRQAEQFTSDLLLIHGTDDANVTVDHTLRLSQALTQAGRQHDLILLTGQRHHLDAGAGAFALEEAGSFLQRKLAR